MLFAPNSECHSISVIRSNHATTEELFQSVEELHIAFVLHHGEFGKNLISGGHLRMRIQSDIKTTFTVHEACDPLRVELHWRFPNVKSLRVPDADRVFPADCPHVRRIFTAERGLDEYRAAVEEFPAYGSVL